MPARFSWTILQQGQLSLQPNGSVRPGVEHRCTTTLIWPANDAPHADNTLMIDPCFTADGYVQAERALSERRISFDSVGHVFVTHAHADHMLRMPDTDRAAALRAYRPVTRPGVFATIEATLCPGHHPTQQALHFTDDAGKRVWVTGDAVLDEQWLRRWRYFWPNGYGPQQVVETWRSVAQIISEADVIVPGHDAPIEVTAELVGHLVESFPQADYAEHCPDVLVALRARLARLEQRDAPRRTNSRSSGAYRHLLALY